MQKDEIIFYLKSKKTTDYIFSKADNIRRKYLKNIVHLRAIIEFSNYCIRNCFYCGIRRSNKKVKRYRMSYKQIYQVAKLAKNLGFKTVVLQSGEDPFYKISDLSKLIYDIRNKLDLVITLSIGEKTYRDYKILYKAGAQRYLLKHETSDKNLYKKLHPDLNYDNRFKCLINLKEIGYQTGSGNIIGLPDQSIESIADDILIFKKLDMDMIGIGPFIPHPETPLKNYNLGDVILTLKTIALTRILTKDTHIPSTTALATINKKFRFKAFFTGANVIMPDITPQEFKLKYEIYPEKISFYEHIDNIEKLKENIKKLGFAIGQDYGHRVKYENI